MSKNKLGLIFFPAFDWSISPTHPEREERLLYTMDQLFEDGIEDIEGIEFYNPEIARMEDLQRVHFFVPDPKNIVTNSHLISTGGAIKALEKIMEGEVDKSFGIIRPPGHHAHRVVYGDRGFCVVNNEAVMLEKIRQKYGNIRAAIVDTDCHHGDGTQDIYWNDPNTLFISFHQDGRTLYPGTGEIEELGGPGGYGYNINIPLPTNTGDEGFLYIMENLVMPILEEYNPDIIINSAGQDNHYSDPLTRMNFTAQGYAKLNHMLDPDVAILEGGYSIEGALPYMNLGIILAMAGLDYSKVKEPDYDPEKFIQDKAITKYIEESCKEIYKIWKNKNKIAEKLFKGQEKIEMQKRIYYDTAGIMENQVQYFEVCNKCSGVNYIDSKSDTGYHILAITIPRDACNNCIQKGYRLYKNPFKNYTNIYLQDRVKDEIFSYEKKANGQ